jgi:hypothetical protein
MRLIKKLYHFLTSWGIDLRTPYYRFKGKDWFRRIRKEFIDRGGRIDFIYPIWSDLSANAGTNKGHYFHQDLLVANLINQANPIRHIDIGSRIDGFVAHVAAFREIEVLDIRHLEPSIHSNIKFSMLDLMSDISESDITDSLSCLHAIEHFGLGRYGDPINPNGHLIGLENMVKLLKKNGTLYISFPITSSATKVYFNAHRVLNYQEILSWSGSENLVLKNFDVVDDQGDLFLNQDINNLRHKMIYGCGIYTLVKL